MAQLLGNRIYLEIPKKDESKLIVDENTKEALEKEMEEELDAEALAKQNTKVSGFVRAIVSEKKHVPNENDVKSVDVNPNQINIEESDDDDDDEEEAKQDSKRQKLD